MNSTQDEGSAALILTAGTSILIEEGYKALSMRKVATRVGLSQAAIYRHYRDKAELVSRIVAKAYEGLKADVENLDDPDRSVIDLLSEGIRRYIAFALARPELFKAVLLQDIGPAGRDVLALSPGVAKRRKTFAIMVALLERGMSEGLFAKTDVEVTAQALWASMFGLAARLTIELDSPMGGSADGAEARRQAVIERQIQLLMRGLRAGCNDGA